MVVNYLLQSAFFNGTYFNQKILKPLAAELQGEGRLKGRP
jgi:hypothetical protein